MQVLNIYNNQVERWYIGDSNIYYTKRVLEDVN